MAKIDQISLQSESGFIDIDDTLSLAQSFKPGVTGNLVSIDMPLTEKEFGIPATLPLVVAIETMVGGKPSGIVLGSTSFAPGTLPDGNVFSNPPLTTVTFTPNIPLQQGVEYAITLKSDQPLFPDFNFYDCGGDALNFTNNNSYPNGSVFFGGGGLSGTFTGSPVTNRNIGFITNMDVDFTPFGDQTHMNKPDFVVSLNDLAGIRKAGQTFTPSVTAKLSKIMFGAVKNIVSSLGDLNIEIQETTAGLPNGSVIGSTTLVPGLIRPQSGSTILDRQIYVVDILQLPVLTSGTLYAIVFSATHDDVNNYKFLGKNTGNKYTDGSAVQANDGVLWGEVVNADLTFATIMQEEVTITQVIDSDAQIAPIGTHTIGSQAEIFVTPPPPTRIDNVSLAAFNFNSSERIHIGFSAAQSFTPSITGKLDSVDLVIARASTPLSDLVISLETIVAGLPDGISIDSVSFSPSSLPSIDASGVTKTIVSFPTKPLLTGGTEYVITLKSTTPVNFTNIYHWYRVFTTFPPDGLMTGGSYFRAFLPNPFSASVNADASIAIRMEAQVNPFIDQFQMGRPLFQSAITGIKDAAGIHQLGQTFTPSETAALTQIWFSVLKVDSGTLGDLDIEIQETTNGVPNGIVIGSTTIPKAELSIFTSSPVTRATIPQAPLLQEGVLYAIVFKATPHDASNRYEFENISSSTDTKYLGGDAVKTEDGVNWFVVSGSFIDLCFATLMAEVVETTQTITSDAIVTLTQLKTIDSNAFVGEITTQIITAEGVVQQETEQTILSDMFVGETTIQNITSDAVIFLIQSEDIIANATVFITTEQTLDAETFIKEPIDFFATAQLEKAFIDDKNIETDLDNSVPAAPTGLVGTDTGKGDSVLLTWTSSAKFFNVFKKDIGPIFTKMNSIVLEDVTVYEVGGLTEGVPVTFIVRALNGLGQESPDSNES